ncbi:hypothetical protein QOT71_15460 [Pseudomonas aeruginosa]|uniref:hypothetical protein n=1 Tax=Pseudomonas aeruginosa TaxID=287 RepID=UPI0010684BFD|nr:hypothetical protein [Pseudomonas aeruginosa]TER18347.1 hypothetical protein IPC48_02300 [Pseudomonas aeruginosa]
MNRVIRTMKLYENVVIGNFLYGLGFAIRDCLSGHTAFPGMINQLQQTPVDKELADVLLSFPGSVRLIEFKMEGADLKKEKLRHRLLTLALSGPDDAPLLKVSRSVHWYVEVSTKLTDMPLVCRAVPYLDAFSPQPQQGDAASLEHLIEQTAREAVGDLGALAREHAQSYLRRVRLTLAGTSTAAGGLLLVMGKGGTMRFAQLQDISELNLPDRLWLDRALDSQEPTLEREGPKLERVLERDGPGIELSM